jgi:tripartite-type tricarboxylate transporter receptor subunit TctC
VRKREFLSTLAAACAAPFAVRAADPPYPSRPLKFVVNFPPGGASDSMARIFAQKLGETIGQTVIVDNHPGAGGAIGTAYAAKQPADGYTIMMATLGSSITQPLLGKTNYDMAKDFTPVSLIGTGPAVLVVNGNSPYKTLAELVAGAKAKPGQLNYGSGGLGTFAHFMGELLNLSAGIQTQHVPYKGGIQALNDVLAGQLDMLAADPPAALPHLRSGKLRALAITSPKRSVLLPEVPTFVESGMPDLVGVNSWSIYMPSGVPKAEFAAFQRALNKTMDDPELVKKFAELGAEAMHSTPEALRKFVASESARYARLIKEKGIHGE